MITQQARPKYTVEQYTLAFSFAENIQGVPVVTVEMLQGEDPNKDLLVGLTVVFRNLALVLISGGVAGCVYNITCEVDEQSIASSVAVIPTEAVPPEGGGVVPFTQIHTTPPYPGLFIDSIDFAFAPTVGSLQTLVQLGDFADNFSVEFSVTTGRLFTPEPARASPEALDLTFAPTAGVMFNAPLGTAEEELTVQFAPTIGTLGPAPLGLVEESIDITFGPIGGALSVP